MIILIILVSVEGLPKVHPRVQPRVTLAYPRVYPAKNKNTSQVRSSFRPVEEPLGIRMIKIVPAAPPARFSFTMLCVIKLPFALVVAISLQAFIQPLLDVLEARFPGKGKTLPNALRGVYPPCRRCWWAFWAWGGLPPRSRGSFFSQLCYPSVAAEDISSVAAEDKSSFATGD